MKITTDQSKYISAWVHVETAKYIDSLNRVIRDKKLDKTLFTNIHDMSNYCLKNGNIRNIHIYLAL
jgi:hypothetical protein